MRFQIVFDGQTDKQMDTGQTDQWTGKPSYRDARTHLKTNHAVQKNRDLMKKVYFDHGVMGLHN